MIAHALMAAAVPAAAPSANGTPAATAKKAPVLYNGSVSAADAATLVMALELFVPQTLPAPTPAAPAVPAGGDTKSAVGAAAAVVGGGAVSSAATAADPNAPALWDAAAAYPLEWQFVSAVAPRLNALLAQLSPPLALVRAPAVAGAAASSGLALALKADRTRVRSVAEVNAALADVTRYLNTPGAFDFAEIVDRVSAATMRAVAEWLALAPNTAAGAAPKADASGAAAPAASVAAGEDVRKALDSKVISAIRPQAIAFNGGEMASFEVDFQAGYRVLMFPDANAFEPAHLAVVNAQKRVRPYLCYSLDALCFPEHELMHCLQMELKQKDDGGWALEHDASRIAFVLTALIAAREHADARYTAAFDDAAGKAAPTPAVPLFPAGKLEEICLYTAKLVTHTALHDATYTAAHAQGYAQWRESFGVVPPVKAESFTFVSENQNVADLFKYGVSLDAYLQLRMSGADARTTLHALLASAFHSRANTNITAKPVAVADAAVIDASKYALDVVRKQRMTADELAAFFKALPLNA